MNRLSIPNVVLATLLVLIVPLERGRCVCGGPGAHAKQAQAAAPAAGADCHDACCAASAAASGGEQEPPAPDAQGCGCTAYSAGVLAGVPSVAGAELSADALVPLPGLRSVEPVMEPREHPLALDVGSPPLPDATGAHGLRAPPSLA